MFRVPAGRPDQPRRRGRPAHACREGVGICPDSLAPGHKHSSAHPAGRVGCLSRNLKCQNPSHTPALQRQPAVSSLCCVSCLFHEGSALPAALLCPSASTTITSTPTCILSALSTTIILSADYLPSLCPAPSLPHPSVWKALVLFLLCLSLFRLTECQRLGGL